MSFSKLDTYFHQPIDFQKSNMILSRAKPAIGGEKTEEKGGSAGRKQVFIQISPWILIREGAKLNNFKWTFYFAGRKQGSLCKKCS